MMKVGGGLLAAIAAGGLLASCGGDGQRVLTSADSVDIAAAVPAAPARTRPSDAQIAHVLNEANAAVLRAALHARSRVASPAVSAYTTIIAADHQAIRATLDSVARAIGLTPAEHPSGNALRADATAAVELLEGLTGPAYEERYLEDEIEIHERALALIDDVLIPSAQDERLRTLVRNVRPAFAAHLQRALQIRRMLAEGTERTDSAATGS
jgi:predicted outer membrane protein